MGLLNWLQRRNRSKRGEFLGYALVQRDGLTQKNYWETFNADGHDAASFSGGQPLSMLDPKDLPIGTRIDLYVPRDSDHV